jgi:general secretion pathway protein B
VSYILDALKKAEKERRRGVVADVAAVEEAWPAKKRGARPTWIYLLLFALFLNAGLLAWWLGPWDTERPAKSVRHAGREKAITATEKVTDAFDASAPVTSPRAKEGSPDAHGKTASDLAEMKPVPSEEVKADRQENGRSAAGDSEIADRFHEERSEAATEAGKGSGATTAAPSSSTGNRIYAMDQLPSSLRQTLPDLTMSLHYFTSDPTSRLITIIGKTFREGQEVTTGLRLEQITPDGAVFSCQHYRFFVGLRPI